MHRIQQRSRFRRKLLAWYKTSQRILPWRQTHDPYAIVVSELMLQQTQVERVIEKYQAWMKRFPTVRSLAGAPRADVIAQWQGLGYNRRALYLHRIAKTIVSDFGCVFPQTVDELVQLPGIGRYTAAAVVSFAYSAHEPIVETNVKRVVGRIFLGYKALLHAPEERLWRVAHELLPRDRRSYHFNQALMDFGALVCTAKRPRCEICPMQSICASYPDILRARPEQLRVKKPVYEKQYFGHPRRIWRGKILAYLHSPNAKHGATESAIGKAIQNDFSAQRLPWLRSVIFTLVSDGFVQYKGKRVVLFKT